MGCARATAETGRSVAVCSGTTVSGTVRGQRAEPFHVTAELSFRWDAAKSARSGTTEEDVLTNLLGAFQRPAEHHAAVATARRVPGRYVAS